VRIKFTTGLAVAAGLLAMVIGGATLHAAVTMNSTDVPKVIPDLGNVSSTLDSPGQTPGRSPGGR